MKTNEFWSELVTAASWARLTEISKKYDFILIGGWAAYLWTKAHKSKDIDIVVDYKGLDALRAEFALVKNERMRKYEIKQGDFDIDVYVSHYSKLAVPAEELFHNSSKVEGIKTVSPEMLVILKQGAEIDRRGSVKGRKDQIDILTIVIYSGFDLGKYRRLLKRYRLDAMEAELRRVTADFDPQDLAYLGLDHQQFVKWKRGFLDELRGK